MNPYLIAGVIWNFISLFIFSQDECSFVSLRDVERSMIVFQYFSQNYKLFCDSVLQKASNADANLFQKVIYIESCQLWLTFN